MEGGWGWGVVSFAAEGDIAFREKIVCVCVCVCVCVWVCVCVCCKLFDAQVVTYIGVYSRNME